MMNKIVLDKVPPTDIPDGLLIEVVDEEGVTGYATSDIKEGEKEYVLPDDIGFIKSVYIKIQ